MKYLKKYNESVKDIFKKLPIEEIDISNILIDLSDLNYDIKYKSFYLGENGKTYTNIKGIGNYYPTILIVIKREALADENDVRRWDGSLYFEDSDMVLESIYHCISRLKETLKGHKIYYNIRNINEIYIRIIFDKELQSDFNRSFAESIIRREVYNNSNIDAINGRFDKDDFTEFYTMEETISTSNRFSFSIKPIINNYYYTPNYLEPKYVTDFIIKNNIDSNHSNNKNDLSQIVYGLLEKCVEKINKEYPIEIKWNGSHTFTIKGRENDSLYIKVNIDYEPYKKGKVLTKKGSFLKKDQYAEYDIYSLDVDIIFLD